MSLAAEIADNLHALRARMADLARSAGRHPDAVQLIAVSKTQPPEAVAAAVAAGQLDFGENTIQDALTKIPRFTGQGLQWHFIGHLQSNKVKFLPGHFQWLHSLDSIKLAERVSRVAHEHQAVIDCLIEVNITRDPAKHGVMPETLSPLLDHLLKLDLPGIRLRGLMTIGPHPATESDIRTAFAAARKLRDDAQARFSVKHFDQLSMGMSGDYREAIMEGSTMVRIGTAIFGERDYSK